MNGSSIKQQDSRPHNVGTSHNLPEEIRARLGGSSVVAWTTLDEAYAPTLGQTTCCLTCGPLMICPCFWPHLIILSPCLCMAKTALDVTIRNTFWILTEQDVKIFVRSANYAGCCYKSGDTLKSVPLTQITDCGIQAPTQGCCGDCVKSIPTIYIDTASVREGQQHEAVGYGLAGYEWFVAAILRQRDSRNITPITAIATPMERGEPETVERRLEQISNLLERGVLTKEEYERKRQEIIASI
jgi:Short C-terminal domain